MAALFRSGHSKMHIIDTSVSTSETAISLGGDAASVSSCYIHHVQDAQEGPIGQPDEPVATTCPFPAWR
jgi:hypothetical protein